MKVSIFFFFFNILRVYFRWKSFHIFTSKGVASLLPAPGTVLGTGYVLNKYLVSE